MSVRHINTERLTDMKIVIYTPPKIATPFLRMFFGIRRLKNT